MTDQTVETLMLKLYDELDSAKTQWVERIVKNQFVQLTPLMIQQTDEEKKKFLQRRRINLERYYENLDESLDNIRNLIIILGKELPWSCNRNIAELYSTIRKTQSILQDQILPVKKNFAKGIFPHHYPLQVRDVQANLENLHTSLIDLIDTYTKVKKKFDQT